MAEEDNVAAEDNEHRWDGIMVGANEQDMHFIRAGYRTGRPWRNFESTARADKDGADMVEILRGMLDQFITTRVEHHWQPNLQTAMRSQCSNGGSAVFGRRALEAKIAEFKNHLSEHEIHIRRTFCRLTGLVVDTEDLENLDTAIFPGEIKPRRMRPPDIFENRRGARHPLHNFDNGHAYLLDSNTAKVVGLVMWHWRRYFAWFEYVLEEMQLAGPEDGWQYVHAAFGNLYISFCSTLSCLDRVTRYRGAEINEEGVTIRAEISGAITNNKVKSLHDKLNLIFCDSLRCRRVADRIADSWSPFINGMRPPTHG